MTTAADVRVAVTGGVYTAPAGTAVPTTVSGALNGAFEELGYLSEEGVTQTIDESTTRIKAWQNGDTVRVVQDSHAVTYAMTFLETSEAVLEAYYGNYDAGVVEIRGDSRTRQPWVLNIVDGDHLMRVVIPDGEITDRGDVQYVNGNAVMYPVTIECYPDGTGAKAYVYTDLEES